MSFANPASNPGDNPAPPVAVDQSADVCRAVDRSPGDIVRCTHIYGRFYRCNWWRAVVRSEFDNPLVKGSQLGTTFRVHRSAFLEVTGSGATLSVRDASSQRRPDGF